MGNLEALKALYTAQGGEASAVAGMTTLAEVIDALSKLGGGGDSDFTVTFTVDEDDNYVSDKTSTEILEQFSQKPIKLVLGYGTYQVFYPMVIITPGSDSVTLQYSAAYYDATDGAAVCISEAAVDASGNVTLGDDKICPLTLETT
ncbi:MAG: hypothetical protein IKF99_00955 [Oscillospiraceae bacterium]|nr:hypothetical protein [Oscillospiraceae bacterium]